MLASTVQFSNNGQPPPPHRPPPDTHTHTRGTDRYDGHGGRAAPPENNPDQQTGLFPQDPTGCSPPRPAAPPHPLHTPTRGAVLRMRRPWPDRTGQCLRPRAPHADTDAARGLLPPFRAKALLRKEVIQPHLPVRLPCYDFVPIASPTFDGSLPQGVRPPASGVADFRDVTGGVYKARERIHRSIADLRLLATPTSRGRVADPDPN